MGRGRKAKMDGNIKMEKKTDRQTDRKRKREKKRGFSILLMLPDVQIGEWVPCSGSLPRQNAIPSKTCPLINDAKHNITVASTNQKSSDIYEISELVRILPRRLISAEHVVRNRKRKEMSSEKFQKKKKKKKKKS